MPSNDSDILPFTAPSQLTTPPFSTLYRRHMGDAKVSELFLPDHFRLGRWNWGEFKEAVELVLRAKGIPIEHLTQPECPPLDPRYTLHGDPPVNAWELQKGYRALWDADEEFCKALIVLNVRPDHIRFVKGARKGRAAATLWADLARAQRTAEEQTARDVVRLCRLGWALAGMVSVFVWLRWGR